MRCVAPRAHMARRDTAHAAPSLKVYAVLVKAPPWEPPWAARCGFGCSIRAALLQSVLQTEPSTPYAASSPLACTIATTRDFNFVLALCAEACPSVCLALAFVHRELENTTLFASLFPAWFLIDLASSGVEQMVGSEVACGQDRARQQFGRGARTIGLCSEWGGGGDDVGVLLGICSVALPLAESSTPYAASSPLACTIATARDFNFVLALCAEACPSVFRCAAA